MSRAYPKTMGGFPGELASLLDTHAAVLDSGLRRQLVGALILLRNRGQVSAGAREDGCVGGRGASVDGQRGSGESVAAGC